MATTDTQGQQAYNWMVVHGSTMVSHIAASTGVHGVGTSTVASAADINTHVALTAGVHSVDENGQITVSRILATDLPTTDPGIVGKFWVDANGFVKVSGYPITVPPTNGTFILCYEYHDDSSPNAVKSAIQSALPTILIDNFPSGLYGSPSLASAYEPLGIATYCYLTGGYQGLKYGNTTDALASNITRIDNIADVDGCSGVFLDEVSADLSANPYGGTEAENQAYIQAIYDECQTKGLNLILNTGLEDFDQWLLARCDYLMSDEAYDGVRVPSVDETAGIAKIMLITPDATFNAATGATRTEAAWTNGFNWHFSCNIYTTLPTWLADYFADIRNT